MLRVPIRSGRGFRDDLPTVPYNAAFERRFGTEEACRDFLFQRRWPDGFRCRRCGPAAYVWLDARRIRCLSCHKNTALTGGTILDRTRKPLTLWFRAAYIMAQHGASARLLQEELHLTYKVAWSWAHKLRRLMALDTKLAAPRPPFEPRLPHADEPWLLERQRQRWDAFHGRYEWEASRGGELGKCCARLTREDWDDPRPFMLGTSRKDLFATCSGSLSDKHLCSYMKQTEFRANRRPLGREENALELLGRFAQARPYTYSTIRGDRPARVPILWRWVPPVSDATAGRRAAGGRPSRE